MAKSLRSNRKKAIKRARNQALKCTWQEEAEARRSAALAKCMAAAPEPIPEPIATDPEHTLDTIPEEPGRTGRSQSGKATVVQTGSGSTRTPAKIRGAKKAGTDSAVGGEVRGEDSMELDAALADRIQQKLHKVKGVNKKKGAPQRKRQVGALHAFQEMQKERKKGRKGRKTLDEIRYML